MNESTARAERFDLQTSTSSDFLWEVPHKPVAVRIPYPLIARLEREAIESFRSVTSKGSEIGGLLVGSVAPGSPMVVSVAGFQLIECEYGKGPLYRLSDADLLRFRQAIEQKGSPSAIAGFFRTHTRKGISLDMDDVAVMDTLFREPHQIALLVRPFATKASTGAIFIREGGKIAGDASYLEFPFHSPEGAAQAPPEPEVKSAPPAQAGPLPQPPSVAKPSPRAQIVPIASRREASLPAPSLESKAAEPAPAPPPVAAPPAAPPVEERARIERPQPKIDLPSAATPEPRTAAKVDALPATKPEPKPEAKVEAKPEPKAEIKPEPKLESKGESKADPKLTPKPEVKAPAKPEPKPEAKVEPKVEPKIEPKAEPKPAAAPEPKPAVRSVVRESAPLSAPVVTKPEPEPEAPAKSTKSLKLILAAAAATALFVLLFVYPGLLRQSRKSPNGVPGDSSAFQLRVERTNGELLLTWNRDSDVIQKAAKAVLTINDGEQHENVEMDLAQLRNGSIVYSPQTADISFKMEVTARDSGKNTSESVRVLRTRPSALDQGATAAAGAGKPAQPAASAPIPNQPTPNQATPNQPTPSPAAGALAPQQQAAEEQPEVAKPVVPTRAFNAPSLSARLRPAQSNDLPDAPIAGGPVSTPIPGVNLGAVTTAAPRMPVPAPPPPAAPAEQKGATKAGGQIQQAILVSKKDPEYPKLARQTGAKGAVRLMATVGKDGHVKSVKILSGHPMLQGAAAEAVKQWIYKPTLLNGVAVETDTEIVLNFVGDR